MIKYVYLLSLLLLPLLFSCEMKKDLLGGIEKPTDPQLPKDAGLLDLELKPEKEVFIPSTKGDEIEGSDEEFLSPNDFAVAIYNEEGILVESYANYAQLKEVGGLLLSPGTYIVKAEKGTNLNAGFDMPYYVGVDTCKIQSQVVEKVITSCKLDNKKVTFRYSDDFQKRFEDDYFIVLENASGILTLKKDETRSAFLKNTGTLRFTVYATTHEGKQFVYNYDISKNDQVNQHNNVVIDLGLIENNPGGGDDDPDNPGEDDEPEDPGDTRPDIPTGRPRISVDVSLVEKDFIIEIPSDILNNGGDGGEDNPGGEDQPEVDPSKQSPTITGTMDGKSFVLGETQTITSGTKSVVINLYLPTGLESLTVRVKIPNVPIDLPLDLLNESDPNLIEIKGVLAGMGKELKTPSKGSKGNQKFDISPFLDLLVQVGGNSSFLVSMKDKNGKSVEQTITLTVKE